MLASPCALRYADRFGMIHIKGSDTMIGVAQSWADAFEKVNTDIRNTVLERGQDYHLGILDHG